MCVPNHDKKKKNFYNFQLEEHWIHLRFYFIIVYLSEHCVNSKVNGLRQPKRDFCQGALKHTKFSQRNPSDGIAQKNNECERVEETDRGKNLHTNTHEHAHKRTHTHSHIPRLIKIYHSCSHYCHNSDVPTIGNGCRPRHPCSDALLISFFFFAFHPSIHFLRWFDPFGSVWPAKRKRN